MAANLAQRRAAKALRRKAIVRAKRKAEVRGGIGIVDRELRIPNNKASAALIHLAEPLTSEADDTDARKKSLTLAMVAWNLSLLPESKRKEQMAGLLEKAAASEDDRLEASSFLQPIIDALVSRKLQLYPLDRRFLVDLQVFETSDGYHVTVASALDAAA
jgi:hypothetical protein